MLLVAFVALDALVVRSAFSADHAPQALAAQFGLTLPAAQLALDRLLYGLPRSRPFWTAFLAVSLLTSLTYWPGLPPLGRFGADALWTAYVDASSRLIWGSPPLHFLYTNRAWHFAAGAVTFFLPPATLGSLAGLAATLLKRPAKTPPA